jgi:protein-arginine kinase activator protein McsA
MYNFNFNKLFNELFRMDDPFFNLENFDKKTYKSEDGSIVFTYITNKRSETNGDNELSGLKYKLELAIESQNFEEAVELRDRINNLEKNKEKISELKKELNSCIKTQDFEKAIELRDKINSLK